MNFECDFVFLLMSTWLKILIDMNFYGFFCMNLDFHLHIWGVWVKIWVNIDLDGFCIRTYPVTNGVCGLRFGSKFSFQPKVYHFTLSLGKIWVDMNLPFHPRDRVGIFCTVVPMVGCQPESGLVAAHFCLFLIFAVLSTCILHFSTYCYQPRGYFHNFIFSSVSILQFCDKNG